MIICFAKEETRSVCRSLESLVEKYGESKARRIKQRLDELDAAHNLAHLRTLPAAKCYLIDEKVGSLAVSTIPPAYILIQPAEISTTHHSDGNLNWQNIEAVEIIQLDAKTHD